VADAVDEDRLDADLASLVSAHDGDTALDCSPLPHPTDVMCNLTDTAARDFLEGSFAAMGLEVARVETDDGAFHVVDLFVDIPGASDSLVLLGAHYDAGFAAANDNSTGVAVLLEAARVLRGVPLEHTVRIVAFDLEELGLVGSSAYVDAVSLTDHVAMVNVDGCGVTSPTQPSTPGLPLPETGNFLVALANEPSIELSATAGALASQLDLVDVQIIDVPGDGTAPLVGALGAGGSDHAPFWVAGIPAVSLSDNQPARDPDYHTAGDDLDGIDPTFFHGSAKVAIATAAYLAGAHP
jgi:Zn-dependent M28 family amino/carboxypeptidase